MPPTLRVEVRGDILYDPHHVIGYDDDGNEIEGGRWCLTIETPDGEMSWSATSAATLVGMADRWGHGRGVYVRVNIITPVGGPE